MRHKILGLALSALVFSISYAFLEYYVIRDTMFGYNPVLFSLIYPYHLAMAFVFGVAAYGLMSAYIIRRGFVPTLIMVGALFSSMLAVEDFTWFAMRAAAPVPGDANAGRLVMPGEWTTQFMGSTDAYFTAIPNWYFFGFVFLAVALVTTRGRQRLAAVASA
jgi:hypothetical protein